MALVGWRAAKLELAAKKQLSQLSSSRTSDASACKTLSPIGGPPYVALRHGSAPETARQQCYCYTLPSIRSVALCLAQLTWKRHTVSRVSVLKPIALPITSHILMYGLMLMCNKRELWANSQMELIYARSERLTVTLRSSSAVPYRDKP